MTVNRRHWVAGLLALGSMAAVHADPNPGQAVDPAYARHHGEFANTPPTVKRVEVPLPDVKLTRDDGRRIAFRGETDDGRPVVLSFIFTTCSTICPTISQTLAQFQAGLGAEAGRVHMMSISLDPEQDTVARLHAYAQQFDAGPQWQHYTGTLEASVAVQRAFGVYRTDKMNHAPVFFLRAAPGQPWLRLDGFATAADLSTHYAQLVSADSIPRH